MTPRRLLPVRLAVLVLLSAATPPLASYAAAASPARHAAGPHPAPATCHGRRATIRGSARWETILGTAGPDVISAGPGNDRVLGLGGDDVICGGGGADTLIGGPGDDGLHGEDDRHHSDRGGDYVQGDTLRGGAGDDLLDPGAVRHPHPIDDNLQPNLLDFTSSPHGVVVTLPRGRLAGGTGTVVGNGRDTIVFTGYLGVLGSAHDDRIDGSADADLIDAGPGDDVVHGYGGDDQLVEYGTGADTAHDGTPHDDDTLDGGPGDDLIRSETGLDRLLGGPGTDFLDARGDEPVVEQGGQGRDSLNASIGPASGLTIDGGPGRDSADLTVSSTVPGGSQITVDQASGRLTAQFGDDIVAGRLFGAEELQLRGTPAVAWTYTGTDADESLGVTGRSLRAAMAGGVDVVHATEGDDVIDGGAGRDAAFGGAGVDRCLGVEKRSSCTAA